MSFRVKEPVRYTIDGVTHHGEYIESCAPISSVVFAVIRTKDGHNVMVPIAGVTSQLPEEPKDPWAVVVFQDTMVSGESSILTLAANGMGYWHSIGGTGFGHSGKKWPEMLKWLRETSSTVRWTNPIQVWPKEQ
jgi:hypothetical protein